MQDLKLFLDFAKWYTFLIMELIGHLQGCAL